MPKICQNFTAQGGISCLRECSQKQIYIVSELNQYMSFTYIGIIYDVVFVRQRPETRACETVLVVLEHEFGALPKNIFLLKKLSQFIST